MRPILQITLNFLEVEDAIRAAKDIPKSVKWIGIGNSLIKSEGIESIGRIKEEFLDTKIVADMMVMDSSAEVEIASGAGADIITVSGMSEDNVLMACVNAGRINGTEIIADLRNSDIIRKRAGILEKLGVNYLLINCNDIDEISDSVQIPIVAECPLDDEVIEHAIETGADIVDLRLNTEEDLGRLKIVRGVIRDKASVFSQMPTKEEFERIRREIYSIKKVLEGLVQERTEIKRRKKRDENDEGFEEQRGKITDFGIWDEYERKKEKDMKKIEDEWDKIKMAEEVIEGQRKKIANEMRRIEREWREIERMTKEIEKKERSYNKEEKIAGGGVRIIGKLGGYQADEIKEPPMDVEIERVGIHNERNIEDDLLRIKEEHKKRKEFQ